MKAFENEEKIIEHVEKENYYYRGQGFDSYSELKQAAETFFAENTADLEDRVGYYGNFGLEPDDVYIENSKTESFFNDEANVTVTVHFYKAYIDSGVPFDSYFHGYCATESF